MQSHSHLDWYSVTFDHDFPVQAFSPMTGGWQTTKHGGNGYTQGWKAECGALAFTGGSEKMGVHVVMGGDALQNLRMGVTDRELCEFTSDNRGRASRLDLTINLINSPLTVRDAVFGWKAHQLKTSARNGWEDRGVHAPGHTLYIGSPSSDRRVRIYDKYAETAVKDPAAFEALKDKIDSWVRIEMQVRNDRARSFQGALSYNPTEEVIKTAMRDFIDWPDASYLEAVSGADVSLPDLPRNPPKFWQWVQTQIGPAFIKYQLENPDERVYYVFGLMLDDMMKKRAT